MTDITLYGTPLSLYTGRARSYLIKARLPYRETTPTTEYFQEQVLPKMGGRRGIPVIQTQEGEVIRDGAAIIDHYEANSGNSFSPTTAKQRILSRLFDIIGAEGLMRPAMHYRWNFPGENLAFLLFHFQTMVPHGMDVEAVAEKNMNRMRNAGRNFGAVEESFEVVESLYIGLMTKLNTHFGEHAYLLGAKPCVGDFGMIAPLYGHLGRDPKPLSMMQKTPRLFRWVERMNRPDADMGEFKNQTEAYLADDEIPETLIEILKHLAIDFMPETRAAADCINQWIEAEEKLEPGTIAERGVGMAQFDLQGVNISALAQPYRFYLLSRVQNDFEAMNETDKQESKALLEACNMSDILKLKLTREIGRHDNREVWL